MQARLDASAQQVPRSATSNARVAHRKTKLLSGLLKCGCCGRDYIVIGKERFGCIEYRAGACANGKSIRQSRIETRVFSRLRNWLLTPDLTDAFDRAVSAEMKRIEGDGGQARVKTLARQIRKLERERASIIRAIKDGARFDVFREVFEALEAEVAALTADHAEAEQAIAQRATPPPDPAEAYVRAVERLEHHLGAPDLVHQAHELLATLFKKIMLTPDDIAADDIAAEIHTDLGRFLCVGHGIDFGGMCRRFFAIGSQLTVILRPMALQWQLRRSPYVGRAATSAVINGSTFTAQLQGKGASGGGRGSRTPSLHEELRCHENRAKNSTQLRVWRNPLKRAVKNLIEALGEDREVPSVEYGDALAHKEWWRIGRWR